MIAGEPPTQFNGVRQLALLREKDANRTSIRFLDEEHFCRRMGTRASAKPAAIARYRRLGPLAPPQSSRSVKRLAMRETDLHHLGQISRLAFHSAGDGR